MYTKKLKLDKPHTFPNIEPGKMYAKTEKRKSLRPKIDNVPKASKLIALPVLYPCY